MGDKVKNICIINHYAGSPEMGMEFRPYYFGKEWVKQGHKVTIILSSYSHYRKKNAQDVKDLQVDFIEGIRYVWIKTPKYSFNGMKRFINMLVFTFKLFYYSKKILKIQKPDLVIASSTYTIDNFPAHYLAKKAKAKYAYEIHDLWPISPIELGGFSKKHPFIILMQWGEDYAYKHADKIISMLPYTKEYMISRGMKPEKWIYIPNGIFLKDWENPMELKEPFISKIENIRKSAKVLIGHVGTIGISNNTKIFVKAIENFDQEKYQMILIGDGSLKKDLMKYVDKNKLNHIHFLKSINKQMIPNVLKYFDILCVGALKRPIYKYGISSNKTFDYMMAGKPIIQAISYLNTVEKQGIGINKESDDLQGIQNAIFKIENFTNEEKQQIKEKAQKIVLTEHNYNILSKKMLEWI